MAEYGPSEDDGDDFYERETDDHSIKPVSLQQEDARGSLRMLMLVVAIFNHVDLGTPLPYKDGGASATTANGFLVRTTGFHSSDTVQRRAAVFPPFK